MTATCGTSDEWIVCQDEFGNVGAWEEWAWDLFDGTGLLARGLTREQAEGMAKLLKET